MNQGHSAHSWLLTAVALASGCAPSLDAAPVPRDAGAAPDASHGQEESVPDDATPGQVNDDGANDASFPGVDDPAREALVYAPPPGIAASSSYDVAILDGRGRERPLFVYQSHARAHVVGANDGADRQAGRTFNWATFETRAPVRVRIRRRKGETGAVEVRPTRLGRAVTRVDARTVELELRPGEKVSVDMKAEERVCYPRGATCLANPLVLFADRLEPSTPPAGSDVLRIAPGNHRSGLVATLETGSARRLVFEAGVHELGYFVVPEAVEEIHLARGAYVRGAIDVPPLGGAAPEAYRDGWPRFALRDRFALTGHGVLSGDVIPWHTTKSLAFEASDSYWRMIKLLQVAAVEVELRDVTLADAPHWTVSFASDADPRVRATMENFKVVASWTYNGDGLPLAADSTVQNCFVHANDDAFKLYHGRGSIRGCAVWQSENGAVFQLGWFPKAVSDVQVSAVDVLHGEWWYGAGENLGVVNYAPGGAGEAKLANLTFTDLHVDGPILRLLGIELRSPGQTLSGLSFERVSVGGLGNDASGSGRFNYLAASGGASIGPVTFRDVQVDGRAVRSTDDLRLQLSGAAQGPTFP